MPVKFFVYLIESPSATDLYNGMTEAPLIRKALTFQSTPCIQRTVVSRSMFERAMGEGLEEAVRKENKTEQRIPLIHISVHGDHAGIQLTDGSRISWAALRDMLEPVEQLLGGTPPLLCMSSCQGFRACEMVFLQASQGGGKNPFAILVGHAGTPTWADTAIAYAAFYHVLAKTDDPVHAVKAMRSASVDEEWHVISGSDLRGIYERAVKKMDIARIEAVLKRWSARS